FDPVASQSAGVFVPLAGAQWSEQVHPYFRIDGRISYRYNRPKWSGVISLDVHNATSRKNTNSVAYNAETNETYFRQYPGGDFIPVLSFQFDF
ncbi:MAG: TonB-dependent receptor, partial [Bacteroidota bacterium]